MARDDDTVRLDESITALERSLETLRTQRARLTASRGALIRFGTLRPTILTVMGHTVLPLSPVAITHLLHACGYRIDRRVVASVLVQLKHDGHVVSLGRGQWRRADLHRAEAS